MVDLGFPPTCGGHSPRAVLFDIDGTLVDSNDAHAAAWVEALSRHGVEVDPRIVRDAIGKGGDKLLPDVAGIADESALGRAITESRKSIFKKVHLPSLRAFPGARELVSALVDRRSGVAFATSASKEEVGALLEIAGLSHLADAATTADDVDRSKPDPDVVAQCVARLGVVAADARLVGDTPYDVLAGGRAGVGVVAVESGGWSRDDLDGALAVYRDVADLGERLETSPLVRAVSVSDAARILTEQGEEEKRLAR